MIFLNLFTELSSLWYTGKKCKRMTRIQSPDGKPHT